MNTLHALFTIVVDLIFLAGLALVAAGLGRIFLRLTAVDGCSPGEHAVFCIGIGFGILSQSVFVLGVLHFLSPLTVRASMGTFALLSLLGWLRGQDFLHYILRAVTNCAFLHPPRPLGEGWGEGIKSAVCGRAGYTSCPGTPWSGRQKGLALALAASVFFNLLLVLTPAVGNDALTYHLEVPRRFLEHGGFYFIPGNIFAHYPLNAEMLYLIGLALRGEILAKGIHFVMLLGVLTAMWCFTRSDNGMRVFAIVSLIIFHSVPSVFMNAHMAYNDLTLAFYTLLSVLAFVKWYEGQRLQWLLLCAVFCGLGMGTKYSALLLPLLGHLGILVALHRRKAGAVQALRLVSLYLLLCILVGCPFYLKNAVMTGNPFYPFFHGVFGGKGWSEEQARFYGFFLHNLGMGRTIVDYLLLPWNVSFRARMYSSQFDGVLGPIFLLVLPFSALVPRFPPRLKIALCYCLFAFLFWAFSAQQIRYLIPILPFLAITIGYTLKEYRPRTKIFSLLVLWVVSGLTFNAYYMFKDFRNISPLPVLTGRENRDAFLTRLIPSYTMFRHVNTHLPEESKIFFIYMKNLGYLCDRPFYSDSMFESYTIQAILSGSQRPEQVYETLRELGFTHILYDVNYVFGSLSTFSDEQKHLFFLFQQRYLRLVHEDKNRYYLYGLAGSHETATVPLPLPSAT